MNLNDTQDAWADAGGPIDPDDVARAWLEDHGFAAIPDLLLKLRDMNFGQVYGSWDGEARA